MKEKSPFYTLRGYQNHKSSTLTASMEDYLEMIYRIFLQQKSIRVNDVANALNVKPSSASKMMDKLKHHNLILMKKYGEISLTEQGIRNGSYLLWRHNTLVTFFSILNKIDYRLEQVEKIEHFIDDITLLHMDDFIKNEKK